MYGEWSGRHIRAVRSRICMCRMREKIVRVLDSHRVFVPTWDLKQFHFFYREVTTI